MKDPVATAIIPTDWPRMLRRDEAARYLGVGVDTFDNEVKAGIWPPPRLRGSKGGRLTWDRKLLDFAADQQSGIEKAAPVPKAIADADEQRAMERAMTFRAREQIKGKRRGT